MRHLRSLSMAALTGALVLGLGSIAIGQSPSALPSMDPIMSPDPCASMMPGESMMPGASECPGAMPMPSMGAPASPMMSPAA